MTAVGSGAGVGVGFDVGIGVTLVVGFDVGIGVDFLVRLEEDCEECISKAILAPKTNSTSTTARPIKTVRWEKKPPGVVWIGANGRGSPQ